MCAHMHTGMQACGCGAQRKTLGVPCQSLTALRKGLSRSFAAWFSEGSSLVGHGICLSLHANSGGMYMRGFFFSLLFLNVCAKNLNSGPHGWIAASFYLLSHSPQPCECSSSGFKDAEHSRPLTYLCST